MCVYVCLQGTYITFFCFDPVINYMGVHRMIILNTFFLYKITLLCMIREGQSK